MTHALGLCALALLVRAIGGTTVRLVSAAIDGVLALLGDER